MWKICIRPSTNTHYALNSTTSQDIPVKDKFDMGLNTEWVLFITMLVKIISCVKQPIWNEWEFFC